MEQSKFEIGDKVKFLNAVGGGIVKKVQGGMVYVEDDTGFDMPFPPTALIRMADQQGAGKVFNTDPQPSSAPTPQASPSAIKARPTKSDPDDTSVLEIIEENRRLRSQNANLQDQIKQLKSQVLSLQRTIARIS
ncbi:MAG: hypothetical protein IJ761_07770 [Bacteroidales bacterium]|nr:hypothetical protein [Bacteroidales bacterium]